MKKILCILMMGTIFLFSGCTKADSSNPSDKIEKTSLYEQGIQVVSLMKEMSESEGYLNAFTNNEQILAHFEGAAPSDPQNPTAVYQITIPDEKILDQLDTGGKGEIPASLRPMLKSKFYVSVPTQFNARNGAETLAAASLCIGSKSFLHPDFSGNVLYLYLYEDGVPVMVSFCANDSHIVNASGCYLLDQSFDTESIEFIQSVLSELSVEITQVNP